MQRGRELGEFLRARRGEVTPDQVGLKPYGQRRVTGLRREELAMLAGVSVGYYTRIEQGQTNDASPAVLVAIARALQLDPQERDYLLALAAPEASKARDYVEEVVSDAVRALLDSVGNVAGMVLGRRLDVLAWSPLAQALIAPHLSFASVDDPTNRPNWARMLFTDRHYRKAFSDWEAKCWDVTSYLRVQSGDHPQDGRLGSLIAELCLSSTVFDDMWTSRRVKDEYTPTCILLHPVVGRVELLHVPLVAMNGSEQILATFFGAPGTPSAAAIAQLAAGSGARARGDRA